MLGLGLWAGDTSSANKQVDILLLRLEVLNKSLEVVLLCDIGRADGDDGTAVMRVVGFGSLLESFCTTASDVNLLN